LRTGIELISDVGIGQNIIYNKNAEVPEFYNTAWTVQIIRSVVLWLLFLAAAWPMAYFYQSPILKAVVPVTAFTIVLGGFGSVSRFLVQKRLQIIKLNLYDTFMTLVSSIAMLLWAYASPTIWAIVLGNVCSTVVGTATSYFLLPGVTARFQLSRRFLGQILHFGKWIFLGSIVYFLSMNIDRLYLGKIVPLELLGIYGIARTISDLAGNLVLRLGNVVLFPFIASRIHSVRSELRLELVPIRMIFLLFAGFGFACLVVTSDLMIKLLYDQRYQAATWILPVLIMGSWFTVLATINESTLLGLGKPSYSAAANGLKFLFLAIGLSVGAQLYGLLGAVVVVALSDLCRYFPILVGQVKEKFSFGKQDLVLSIVVFTMIAALEWMRSLLGYGTSLASLPL
jgi:O-antigen/teichoic acid export membrane protein